jgi:dipeptidyl-peptidase-4
VAASVVTAPVDSFPRQYARTRQFQLGEPRSFTVSPDGTRVVFLRSMAGDDPVHRLWVHDVATGEERCVADPSALGEPTGDLPPEERMRRERVRESAEGIVAYAVDRTVKTAVFALAGQLWVCDLGSGDSTRLQVDGPVVDPRLDPSGQRVAYVRDRALWVRPRDGSSQPTRLVREDDAHVSWGLAEFVAAEEMDRTRGFWWSPDGQHLAVARVDVRPVQQWHIAHPVDPSSPPTVVRYPAAGTTNADVRLAVVGLDGTRVEVEWDREGFEYLASVRWDADSPLTLVVQSRDQRAVRILAADPESGTTKVVREDTDPQWVDLSVGAPEWVDGGRLVSVLDAQDTRRVAVDGEPTGPPGLHVRHVVHAGGNGVVVVASGDDPTALGVWRLPLDPSGAPALLSDPSGVTHAAGNDKALVFVARGLDRSGAMTTVTGSGGTSTIRSCATAPQLVPRPQLLQLGPRGLRAALLLPSAWQPEQGPLPVLLDPYGGPHAQRVLRSRGAFLVPQWFADQGFAVLVADGRGTPGRGHDWERAVAGDLAAGPLEDQVDALEAAVAARPDTLDPARVAIRGWSFGGFLAALAVLRRPDVFHAAVAGAPVTNWVLYDTHYTERYLGLPQEHPNAYRRSSLLEDAPRLSRPLLLIHGLADDNVVAAHTLQLSRALLEAGRPHTVLPLSGVTHITPQETVAENLLLLQLDFIQRALGLTPDPRLWQPGADVPR